MASYISKITMPGISSPIEVKDPTVATKITEHNNDGNAHSALLTVHNTDSTAHSALINTHLSDASAHTILITNHKADPNAHPTLLSAHNNDSLAHNEKFTAIQTSLNTIQSTYTTKTYVDTAINDAIGAVLEKSY